jgi:hypothetical protein
MRLRSCRTANNPYSSRNEIVGTTNRSIEAIPSAWLRLTPSPPVSNNSRDQGRALSFEDLGGNTIILQPHCYAAAVAAANVNDHRGPVEAIANDHSRRCGAVCRLLPLG